MQELQQGAAGHGIAQLGAHIGAAGHGQDVTQGLGHELHDGQQAANDNCVPRTSAKRVHKDTNVFFIINNLLLYKFASLFRKIFQYFL